MAPTGDDFDDNATSTCCAEVAGEPGGDGPLRRLRKTYTAAVSIAPTRQAPTRTRIPIRRPSRPPEPAEGGVDVGGGGGTGGGGCDGGGGLGGADGDDGGCDGDGGGGLGGADGDGGGGEGEGGDELGGGGEGEGGGGLGGADGSGADGGSASHRSQVFLQPFFSLFE